MFHNSSFKSVNGASFFTWIHQHFLGHHPYTNVTDLDKEIGDSIDPDVCTNNPDIRRIKPHQKWFDHYRYQFVILFFKPNEENTLNLKSFK